MRILASILYFVFFLLSGQNTFYANNSYGLTENSKQEFLQKVKLKFDKQDSSSTFFEDTDNDSDTEEDCLDNKSKHTNSELILSKSSFLNCGTFNISPYLGYNSNKFKREIRSCFSTLIILIRVLRI